MVGPARPAFVLFGSSIVQFSSGQGGWGATLATLYARKADIFVRGYAGWNTRLAIKVLDEVFPEDDPAPPSLVIVYFGGNDAALPRENNISSHVPLFEYLGNMTTIAARLQGIRLAAWNAHVIFLTAPPINETQMLQMTGYENHRNEMRQEYADELEKMFQNSEIKVINLCNLFKHHDDWETTFFLDGMHFTEKASQVVVKEILKIIKEANWEPSLHWQDMTSEFDNVSYLDDDEKETIV